MQPKSLKVWCFPLTPFDDDDDDDDEACLKPGPHLPSVSSCSPLAPPGSHDPPPPVPPQDYVTTLPATDRPEAFGQHPNAEISYLIEDSKVLLDSLLSLQPRTAAAVGGMKREDLVMNIATDLLEQVRAGQGRGQGQG